MHSKALTFIFSLYLIGLSTAKFVDYTRYRKTELNEQELTLSEKLEQIQEGTYQHPSLQASSFRIQDVRLSVLNDFNQVMPFKLGGSSQVYWLVPDTNVNEVAVITDKCKNCTGIATTKWTAPAVDGKNNIKMHL